MDKFYVYLSITVLFSFIGLLGLLSMSPKGKYYRWLSLGYALLLLLGFLGTVFVTFIETTRGM